MSTDLHMLSGAYALDALPEDEQAEFEAHLAECASCRQEVDELQATAAHLGASLSEPPPAGLRAAVMAQIDETRQEPPAAPARPGVEDAEDADGVTRLDARRPSSGRNRWWLQAAASAAAIVVIGVVGLSVVVANLNERIDTMEGASSQMVEVLAAPDAETLTVEGPGGSFARVVVAASRDEAIFVTDGMPAIAEDETYELWLIDEEGPAPAGLFDVDDRGRASSVMTGNVAGAAAIAVTVEPAGGSPEPTSDPLMVVELEEV